MRILLATSYIYLLVCIIFLIFPMKLRKIFDTLVACFECCRTPSLQGARLGAWVLVPLQGVAELGCWCRWALPVQLTMFHLP